ncbi:MAG: sulfotransferase [Anaerolineae bacterium]
MDFQTVFLVGASRSGTTWLQHMLGAHPNVVTTQETDLFSQYIEGWRRTWSDQTKGTKEEWLGFRFKGLPAILTEDEFHELMTRVVAAVYRKIMDLKPSATTLLDKDPPHSLHVDLICRYLPKARFIHVIRDGRDVVTSLMAASKGWGRVWAPSRFEDAASMWRDYVLAARQAEEKGHPYMEVRYEDLSADGAAVLKRLFDFCLVEASLADCTAIYDRFTFERMKSQPAQMSTSIVWGGEVRRRYGTALQEPDGFFGKGETGAWKETWGPYERWRFDRIAGELLADLGYADEEWSRTGFLHRKVFPVREATGLWLRHFLRSARQRVSAF